MLLRNVLTGEIVEGDFASNYWVAELEPAERVDDTSITEQAYIPHHVQIMEMMQGGARLKQLRQERFDSTMLGQIAEIDIPIDPLRHPGVDIIDVMKVHHEVMKSVEYKAAQEKEKAEKEQAAVAAEEKRAEVERLVDEKLKAMSRKGVTGE